MSDETVFGVPRDAEIDAKFRADMAASMAVGAN